MQHKAHTHTPTPCQKQHSRLTPGSRVTPLPVRSTPDFLCFWHSANITTGHTRNAAQAAVDQEAIRPGARRWALGDRSGDQAIRRHDRHAPMYTTTVPHPDTSIHSTQPASGRRVITAISAFLCGRSGAAYLRVCRESMHRAGGGSGQFLAHDGSTVSDSWG